eukprot:365219-Chlamydomonas_euryale.AAC.46
MNDVPSRTVCWGSGWKTTVGHLREVHGGRLNNASNIHYTYSNFLAPARLPPSKNARSRLGAESNGGRPIFFCGTCPRDATARGTRTCGIDRAATTLKQI